MKPEQDEQLRSFTYLLEALTIDTLPNEDGYRYCTGQDIPEQTTEELLSELTFLWWVQGFNYMAHLSKHKKKLPDNPERKAMIQAELTKRGVDPIRDYHSRPVAPAEKPKPVRTQGVEL